MAGCVFGKICHSSCGLSIFFLFLKDFVVLRKFTVSPQYSCLERILATVSEHQLNCLAGGLPQFLPILFQYCVGVITLSVFSFLAICVGPKPETHISKICLTIFAAGSSISHSFGVSGFFITDILQSAEICIHRVFTGDGLVNLVQLPDAFQ